MTLAGGTPVHVSYAGTEYTLTGDAKPKFKDGLTINSEANADGSLRRLFEVGPWTIEGLVVEGDFTTYTQLLDLQKNVEAVDFSIELIDGKTIVAATGGYPTEVEYDPATATVSMNAVGGKAGRTKNGLKAV